MRPLANLRQLQADLAANEATIGKSEAFILTDWAFHYVLAEIRRNPIFGSVHQALGVCLTERCSSARTNPGEEGVAYQVHKAIYEGVATSDPGRAEPKMRGSLVARVAEVHWWVGSPDGASDTCQGPTLRGMAEPTGPSPQIAPDVSPESQKV